MEEYMTIVKRKQYSAKEKVSIVRKHLIEGVSVADVCDENGLKPSVFYRWQKELFEHGTAAFERRRPQTETKRDQQVTKLEDRLQKKDSVIAEIMGELIAQKKRNGEI